MTGLLVTTEVEGVVSRVLAAGVVLAAAVLAPDVDMAAAVVTAGLFLSRRMKFQLLIQKQLKPPVL